MTHPAGQPKQRTRRAAAAAVAAVALGTGAGIALAASAGTRDGGFAPVGSGLNGAVNAIAIQPDGRIVVGGAFTAYDGTGRSRIARLTTTGALDSSFDPGSGLDGPVEGVALRTSGDVLVAGGFSKADGQNRGGLAEFGPTGSLDAGFDTGTGTGGAAARAVLALPFDARVSGVHAVMQLLGGAWAVEDDGLSRNGTFVNGIRVTGRTRLRNRDWLRAGDTILVFRNPAEAVEPGTIAATEHAPPDVTPAQRRVLVALCGPQVRERRATPATNQEIADECVLSIDGVKSHLKELYSRFRMDDVPQNDKRAELARRALETGVVTEREVRG